MIVTVRVELPASLRLLAHSGAEVELAYPGPATQRALLDALEAAYPMLRGTIRDHDSKRRRPFIRFFGCGQDLSHQSPDDVLPEAVSLGNETFMIVGAIAGG